MPPVNVINESGAIFSLPSEQLDAALSQGFREATPEQITHYDKVKASGGTLGQGQAFFGSAANGLTLGAFNPLLEKFSPERAAQLKIAQEANPGASTAGDVFGFAGTAVNPIVGLAAKPAAALGKTVAGATPGVLRTIAGKTIEGAALGTELGAPKAAAEAVTGDYEEAAETLLASGKYGGAFGFLLGAGQVAAQKAAPVLSAAGDYIGDRAKEGLQNQQVKALGAIQSDVAKLTPEKIDRIVAKAEERGIFKIFQSKASRLEKIEELSTAAGQAKTQAIDDMTAAGIQLDSAPLYSKANEIISEKGQFQKLGKAYVKAANDITDDIAAQGSSLSPRTADELKMTLGPEGWDTYGRPIDTARGYVAREMYGAIKGEIVASAERAGKATGLGAAEAAKFTEASANYDIFGDLERWALRAKNRGANQGVKLSDIGFAAIGGQLGGVAGAVKGWILNQARHEFGNMAMVKTLQGTLKAGESVSDFIKEWGPKALNGKVSAAAKIGSINAVRELTGERDNNKATEQVVKNLSQFVTNPAASASILAQSVPELSQADPRVTAAVHQKAILMAQALLSSAPKKPFSGSPFETDPGYTTAQIRDFNKKISLAMNPLSAMKDLSAGRLDPDSVALIRTLYPKLFGQMQKAVIDDAASTPRNYNYSQKLNLSLFLGSPVDSIGKPENIKTFQDNFQKKDKTPNKSREKPKDAANNQTAAQRIEGR